MYDVGQIFSECVSCHAKDDAYPLSVEGQCALTYR